MSNFWLHPEPGSFIALERSASPGARTGNHLLTSKNSFPISGSGLLGTLLKYQFSPTFCSHRRKAYSYSLAELSLLLGRFRQFEDLIIKLSVHCFGVVTGLFIQPGGLGEKLILISSASFTLCWSLSIPRLLRLSSLCSLAWRCRPTHCFYLWGSNKPGHWPAILLGHEIPSPTTTERWYGSSPHCRASQFRIQGNSG